MKFTPLKRRILRGMQFWHNPSYKDISEKSWILAPPPKTPKSFSAIYLDNQLDKIISVPANGSRILEYARIKGEWKEFRPTIAYLLRSPLLANGCLYKGSMKMPLLKQKERMILFGDCDFLDTAILSSSYVSNVYFCHFIQDELPLILSGQKLGEPITPLRKAYDHEPAYRDFCGLHTRQLTSAKFNELLVIDDISWNDDKVERYEMLRAHIKNLIPASKPVGAFFRRGSSGSLRLLVNEPEVAVFLEKRGFVILDPQNSSAKVIMEKSMGAQIVAGVEGSQLAPGLLSVKDHGTVLVLQPPNRFNNIYKVVTDALEMSYSFVVGSPADKGFKIDINELGKTLDLIAAKSK
jgi:hypothetical protein